jgi:hypothetical protein
MGDRTRKPPNRTRSVKQPQLWSQRTPFSAQRHQGSETATRGPIGYSPWRLHEHTKNSRDSKLARGLALCLKRCQFLKLKGQLKDKKTSSVDFVNRAALTLQATENIPPFVPPGKAGTQPKVDAPGAHYRYSSKEERLRTMYTRAEVLDINYKASIRRRESSTRTCQGKGPTKKSNDPQKQIV